MSVDGVVGAIGGLMIECEQDRMEVRIQVESNNGLEGLAYDPL